MFDLDEPHTLDAAPGAYILCLQILQPIEVEQNRFNGARLKPGLYLYCGSAKGPGGLAARLKRHLRAKKKPHWHIDQLTIPASDMAAIAVPGGEECELVDALLSTGEYSTALEGFGSSDCNKCRSHLLTPC